jgi:hypothetical protein
MDVNTFIKAAESGDLQKVKEYIDGGGKVDAKNEVSRAISILIMCLSHHLKYLIYSC